MSNNIAISVTNLNKSYFTYGNPSEKLIEILFNKKRGLEKHVLKDISFEIEKGKTVAVIGTNGAGKSTLLQCIAGTQGYSSGDIQVNGRLTALLELGAGFNGDFSGMENIYVSAGILGLSKEEIDARVEKIVAFADIGEYIYQPVSTYSSGMYVRLAFAIASHTSPDVMIVDEALSVGDVFFQQKCNLFMKNELKDITKLIVSHDLSYISRMADSVILLHEGEIFFNGDPLNAIEHYLRLNQSDDSILRGEVAKKSTRNEGIVRKEKINLLDKSKLSGKLDAYFSEISVQINGDNRQNSALVGDTVDIIATIYAEKDINEPIIGYFLNDKFGTTICGETNREYGTELKRMHAGKSYTLSLSFKWPHIKDDDYFLNIGLGDGHEPFNHVIQCWNMNFMKITGITREGSTHGIFNNKIEEFVFYES